MSDVELRSLAPIYEDEHHKTYVSRLGAAVKDSRNKNIALTGRYGSGKSSILDKFIELQEHPEEISRLKWKRCRPTTKPQKVLRISINTLGPDEDEDLTNRIQKELVKQLVYRARSGQVITSKFARAPKLTKLRAALDAFGVAAAVIGVFWLFGLRPEKGSMGTDSYLLPMITLFVLTFAVLWAIRWYVGSRVVAQVSAGGASISLEGKDESFFDKYLDELITFFEATEPDIVIFEDLDRFDDPRIFDSLRELNTLVNSSAHWVDRPDRPLRFIYAIKDSLFEKLGGEQQYKDSAAANEESRTIAEPIRKDTASEAVERANRTKFFELVIPVVPFLSHSNARDHLLKELDKLALPNGVNIDRGLIDIVARHTTDMRLMINIVNEFVVYAERLLWIEDSKRTPGLSPDRLFAIVVYKNFHLADFEALPQRASVLDMLEKRRRQLVDKAIQDLGSERASLVRGTTRQQKQEDLAAKLGQRLAVFLKISGTTLTAATVGSVSLDVEKTDDMAFWQPVGQAGSITMATRNDYGRNASAKLGVDDLRALFPEAADPSEWLDPPLAPTDLNRISAIDTEVAKLRGASFKSLADDDRYEDDGKTFGTIIEEVLPSELVRELVRAGHIDRFYAEYATVFYGEFLGVDVANFFRNCVWPNEMDMHFSFFTDGAVGNILEQAPVDFLRTRSALNIEIVNHLMDQDAASSNDLIDFLAGSGTVDGKQFLRTYFNTPNSGGIKLASLLAQKPWPQLFNFIAAEGVIDADDMKVELLSAGVLSVRELGEIKLDDAARACIARHHAEIPAFRDPQDGVSTEMLFAVLRTALPSIPSLRALSPNLRRVAVESKRYELTAANLRDAAGIANDEPISADNLLSQGVVWEHCAEHIDEYLVVVENDENTTVSCSDPGVLVSVIDIQHEEWLAEQLEAFLDASAESAALPDITAVEQSTWKAVVEAARMVPNVSNLETYMTEIDVDDALGRLLADDADGVVEISGLENANREQLGTLVLRFLNVEGALSPRQRVLLAKQLLAVPAAPNLDFRAIEARPDTLLAEMLRETLAPDSEEVFAHFSSAGWDSIGPGLLVSTNASAFLTPTLVAGHAADLVGNSQVPDSTRREVLNRLPEFAPAENPSFLVTAASAARDMGVLLSTKALMLIAPFAENHEDIVWQLHEHGKALDTTTVLQILGLMSGDFAGFAGASGEKFEVPDTASMGSVLIRLKAAGLLAFQPGRQPTGRWKLRIV